MYFYRALEEMGVAAENAVMIGDDLLQDVGGAIAVGMQSVLVRTGKFRESDARHPGATLVLAFHHQAACMIRLLITVPACFL